jgi:uncharacterized protein with HEPN domain
MDRQQVLDTLNAHKDRLDELEAVAPATPWHQIRGIRNAVIHEYFRVDVETV